MARKPGEKLGPYEILELLGKGGMGEVYRAHDARLRRDVALKVSAEHFTERFEKEARAVASLNHPNVCTLYDVGPDYLVMELVEGQTLADRIKEGAIAVEEALSICRQIADALEAAHDKGITHRDLKPGNIIMKPDGTAKVLDFGLAKIGGGPTVQSDNSPTMTIGATEAGVILGTASYMAPEQARGKNVDRRADIWAFGVVLYEMLTGQKLFKGDDLTETMAAVIKEEPKLDRVPAKVRRLLSACLQKDPKQRLQTIADWRLLLHQEAPPAPVNKRTQPWMWPTVAAAAMLALAIVVAGFWRATRPVDHPLVRLDMDLGADVSLPPPSTGGSAVVISPDGTRLAYVSGNPAKLFTRRLDQPKATELAGTGEAQSPFFSPDGQWIGFYAGGPKLNKVSVDGGAVVPLANFGGFGGASWGEDGEIIVGDQTKGLLQLPSAGGMPTLLAAQAKGEIALVLPQILPGGKAVLFHMAPGFDPDKTTLEVLTLADRRRKIVARGGTTARYLPTSGASGHLIYVIRATMFAMPFDLDKLEARGNAVPVLDDVAYPLPAYTGQYSFSRNGNFGLSQGQWGLVADEDSSVGRWGRQEGIAAGQTGRVLESERVTGRLPRRVGG
jgi:serine/threonine-protein kinase